MAEATVKKLWKVGDRVCFAHEPLGQVYKVERVGKGEEPLIEITNGAGIYASHLFVPAPAEPIDLPAVEVTPLKDSPRRQHPKRAIVGADRPGHASPTDPGAGSTSPAPESPAPAEIVNRSFDVSVLARRAYYTYGKSTRNKNFRGEEMPMWEDLPTSIQTAWKAVVKYLFVELL